MRKRRIPGWLKIVALVYAIIGIAFYFLQERIIFHPTIVSPDSSYHFKQRHDDVWIPVDKETTTHLIQFKLADSVTPRGVILYFHGNRGNIKRYSRFVDRFLANDHEVWMVDYPGFGKSTGALSEQAMYEQALQVYKLARTRFEPSNIMIYGKSMGSGVAAQLASIRDCKALVLETPYYSMRSLIGMYMWMYPLKRILHFQFPSNEYLQQVTAPITIFHGTNDGVIPYRNAARLKELLKPNDLFITIEGGTHRNLNSFPLMQQKLDSLLAW